MRMSKTISRLSRIRKHLGAASEAGPLDDRLKPLPAPSHNPGNLRGRTYLPVDLPTRAPLVVVLHGCTQTAALYDHGSGWSRLADRHGFALLFPEQKRENNINLCFNWFQPEDIARGSGEAASIRTMIGQMVEAQALDPERTFVTGLSAGGAMASAMLAAYPDVFAAGAIIAGLPYGCADTLAAALGAMNAPGEASARALGDAVRAASPHRGPWPRISVWHGSADRIVAPGNGEAIVRQWRDVHGLGAQPDRTETVDGYPRRTWAGAGEQALIEAYVVTGMGHGTPLSPGSGEGRSGTAGAHMLDVGLSSTDRIAAFFGIAPQPASSRRASRERLAERSPTVEPANDTRSVIETALRAAGLMR